MVDLDDHLPRTLAGARTQRETSDLDVVLSGYHAIPPNEDITRRARYLINTYARSHGLDTLDALIAATAFEEGLTLTTKTGSTSGGAGEDLLRESLRGSRTGYIEH